MLNGTLTTLLFSLDTKFMKKDGSRKKSHSQPVPLVLIDF